MDIFYLLGLSSSPTPGASAFFLFPSDENVTPTSTLMRCAPDRAILQDPTTYRNPTVFDPTRFLTREGTLDPSKNVDPAFGYGRRVCPGRSAAMSMMYISIATTLAAFNVTKAVDEDGFHIKPSCEYTGEYSTYEALGAVFIIVLSYNSRPLALCQTVQVRN